MNDRKRLVSVLLGVVLISSLLGWYTGSNSSSTLVTKDLQQQWQLPTQPTKNLTVFNAQLTNLKIWGQDKRRTKTKSATAEWRLVGITRVKGMLKALIEMKDQLSLKRVSPGEQIIESIQLLSISEESIKVSINGKKSEIQLYQ